MAGAAAPRRALIAVRPTQLTERCTTGHMVVDDAGEWRLSTKSKRSTTSYTIQAIQTWPSSRAVAAYIRPHMPLSARFLPHPVRSCDAVCVSRLPGALDFEDRGHFTVTAEVAHIRLRSPGGVRYPPTIQSS